MKWRNHALMAGSIAALMNLSPAEILYCAAAVNLPDQIEKIGKVRVIPHRTWTHELLLWLAPVLVLHLFPHFLPMIPKTITVPVDTSFSRAFTIHRGVLFLPGVLHLAGDMLTPRGILVAGRNVSFKLFSTGQPMEYVVTSLFVLLASLFRLHW